MWRVLFSTSIPSMHLRLNKLSYTKLTGDMAWALEHVNTEYLTPLLAAVGLV